jgi:hypothetical protein
VTGKVKWCPNMPNTSSKEQRRSVQPPGSEKEAEVRPGNKYRKRGVRIKRMRDGIKKRGERRERERKRMRDDM